VVVYDGQSGFAACRLWWTIRYFGHDAVAVLDDGLAGWPGPLATGWHSVPWGGFVAGEPRTWSKVDYRDVRELPGDFSAPWGGHLDSTGRFKPPDELFRRFSELRVQDGSHLVALR
jgi:thiosulfate/3-mercaptopyruvate sulfurtransferase